MSNTNSSEQIVVTGATGTVGRCVVDGLLATNQSVRAVSRNPEGANLPMGGEVVYGDLTKTETLVSAFESASSLVLFADPETVNTVISSAQKADIKYIVLVSSAAVTAGYDTTWNFVAEQAVQNSGIAWSIVRPGEFMMNTLQIWGPSIRKEQRVVEPFPDQVGSPIHERDIADVVVANLLDPKRRGFIDTIIGPKELSKRQQVNMIAKAIGKDIVIDKVAPKEARAFYKKQGGFAAANADFLFGFESYDGVEGEYDEPHETAVDTEKSDFVTINEIIGKPARTFTVWTYDHTADFIEP